MEFDSFSKAVYHKKAGSYGLTPSIQEALSALAAY